MQVKKRLTPFAVVANYTYNALGQRISEQYDCNDSGNTGVTDGVTDSYDPVFFIALDRAGRRVATFRGTDTNPKETFIYHAGGSSSGHGPNFAGGGGVLLRDRDAACATPSNWATTAASATRAERYFYFADSRGSIMALVSAGGVLAEQYRYSQTGVPFGIPGGDMDADGTVQGGSGQTDENIVKTTTPYEVRKDLDLDGVVDGNDQAIVNAANGTSAGRGMHGIATIGSHYAWRGKETRNFDNYKVVDLLDQGEFDPNVPHYSPSTNPPTPLLPDGTPSTNPSDQSCCNQRRPKPNVVAETICCGPRFVICYYLPYIPQPRLQAQFCSGWYEVQACVIEHEQFHVRTNHCLSVIPDGVPYNPPVSPRLPVSCEECFAYQLQEQCLYRRLATMCPDADQRKIVLDAIADIQETMATKCNQCMGEKLPRPAAGSSTR